MNKKTFAAVALCLAALAAHASAATVFDATLVGTSETPPNGSPATGTGVFTLSTDEATLEVMITFSGLTAPDSAAHIHCCAVPGIAAGVVLPFTGAAGFPTGVTSGTFDHTFTLATDLSGITPTNFITGLFGGLAYANIHDANFPAGEIRGQLVQVTPEPATWGLMGLAIAGLGVFRARRIRKS
jgi:hypothetical protein